MLSWHYFWCYFYHVLCLLFQCEYQPPYPHPAPDLKYSLSSFLNFSPVLVSPIPWCSTKMDMTEHTYSHVRWKPHPALYLPGCTFLPSFSAFFLSILCQFSLPFSFSLSPFGRCVFPSLSTDQATLPPGWTTSFLNHPEALLFDLENWLSILEEGLPDL